MRRRDLKLAAGLLLVQLLLLPDQVNAARNRTRRQRSKPEVQAQHPDSEYDYEYYENYDYEEKNGEALLNLGRILRRDCRLRN